jgi:glutaredoxin-like protein NrdH
MSVIVYTKPSSQQCIDTCRDLDSAGVEYYVYDLSENPYALEGIREAGFLQAPVVFTPWGNWSGHQTEKIFHLAKVLRGSGESKDEQESYDHAVMALRSA